MSVVASGLYELLAAPVFQRSMEGVCAALRPRGCFMFTTQVWHPQIERRSLLHCRHKDPPGAAWA